MTLPSPDRRADLPEQLLRILRIGGAREERNEGRSKNTEESAEHSSQTSRSCTHRGPVRWQILSGVLKPGAHQVDVNTQRVISLSLASARRT